MMKRLLDIVASVMGLLLVWPLFVLIAVLIKLGGPGPVFWRQERMGRGFRPFRIFKFRTMVPGAAAMGPPVTAGNDPRVTRLGRLLRRTKFDELPQLLNVLRGDMSIVGPRPEVRQFVEQFRADYETILSVRPGITDLASLKYRDEETILAEAGDPQEAYVRWVLPDKIRLSKAYVRDASVGRDLTVITQTALRTIVRIPRTLRRSLLMATYLGLVAASNYGAFWLRFDGQIPPNELQLYVRTLGWLLALRGAALFLSQAHEGLWQYAGLWDLRRSVVAVATSTAAFVLVVVFIVQRDYPRSIFIIDSLLLVMLIGGLRLTPRLIADLGRQRGQKRLLIIGAGDAGERVLRDLQRSIEYEPVGLLDDDELKIGQRMHGVPVIGTMRDLPRIMKLTEPEEVLVAMPGASAVKIRSVLTALAAFKVPIRRLDQRSELSEAPAQNHIHSLSIEDLLMRAPVGLDLQPVRELVTGRRVLVTGAGGSIGSELCRQIARLDPAELVLFERYENNLYLIAEELASSGTRESVRPIIADITDEADVDRIMALHRPQVVFHAAAHKHVPVMELNPCQAVRNNVRGTRLVLEAADRHRVERAIVISTDKAVNPSSVMGATKRVVELVTHALSTQTATHFSIVRFGNVLGSNGSVVPRFREQIKAGGPVTVTHRDVRRYFMLTSEAVQLVLQAATLADARATFVLEMGEQVSVLELAQHLIRLSGFVPHQDIQIELTGLRPGEKLEEELVSADEVLEPSRVPSVLRVLSSAPDPVEVMYDVLLLEKLAIDHDTPGVLDQLHRLVPTFSRQPRPQSDAWPAERPAAAVSSRLRASGDSRPSGSRTAEPLEPPTT